MSEPDRELLGRLAHGDMEALGALYDRHARRVYHVLLARGLRDEEADEVLPEVFLALAECGRKLRGVEDALAYLLGIARHLAHRVRKQRPEGTPAAPEPESRDDDGTVAAMHLVRQLPVEQAEVVVLKVWHGFTFDEIGQVLAVSPNTAASRYRYGIEKLRAMWDEG